MLRTLLSQLRALLHRRAPLCAGIGVALALAFTAAAGKIDPGLMHTTNLILHLLNSVLVLVLAGAGRTGLLE